ncbi:hypothetical protein ACJX0J_037795 [Zea mays]
MGGPKDYGTVSLFPHAAFFDVFLSLSIFTLSLLLGHGKDNPQPPMTSFIMQSGTCLLACTQGQWLAPGAIADFESISSELRIPCLSVHPWGLLVVSTLDDGDGFTAYPQGGSVTNTPEGAMALGVCLCSEAHGVDPLPSLSRGYKVQDWSPV